MKKCHRCGRCCTYFVEEVEYRCRFLIGIIGKITSCRIYKIKQENQQIDRGIFCLKRELDNRIFPNCEYNKGIIPEGLPG